jgi:hypothetical protein
VNCRSSALGAAIIALLPSVTWATTIDLVGLGHPNYNNTSSFTVVSGGVTASFSTGGGLFTYNPGDGLGVRLSYEDDEIESLERVSITFSRGVIIDSIYVTDLFHECRLVVHCYDEIGGYTLGSVTGTFSAPSTNISSSASAAARNGELSVPLGLLASAGDAFTLSAPGYVDVYHRLSRRRGLNVREDHEFSLGSVTFTVLPDTPVPEPVPEPETLVLTALGVATLAAFHRLRGTAA